MNRTRWILLGLVIVAVGLFFGLGLDQYFEFERLLAAREDLEAWRDARPVLASAAFFLIYVAVTALSLPGAAIMTLAGGLMFGLLWGTLLVSFASTIGATLAFLIARLIAKEPIQRRYGDRLRRINDGFRREGAFYLFALRLVPAFPFFLINIAMALMPIRAWTFYWVSQVGMLPGTVVYVNAGTQLGLLEGPGDVLSPVLIASFVALGLFPLVARRVVAWMRARHARRGWRRPRRFDRNLVVIGAGSAGLVSAYIAATLRARVTLVESGTMGGDCLNTGCVPSKSLIRTARLLDEIRRAPEYGIAHASAEFDFGQAMERVQSVIRDIAPHDSRERYESLGVEVIEGHAELVSPWTVAITEPEGSRRELSTRAIVLATGGRPAIPPIPGLDAVDYHTSDTIWSLRECPRRMVVLGGGPIGCELAQTFHRLGASVALIGRASRLLPREDQEFGDALAEQMRVEGVQLVLGAEVTDVSEDSDGIRVSVTGDSGDEAFMCDTLLIAAGREANVEGLGLERLGIPSGRTIEVNEALQTRFPHILACGDAAGPYQFTHAASHTAWFATVNALFGGIRRFRVDHSIMPWCTFTSPEIARVGLNEQQAKEQGIGYEVTTFALDDFDRAIVDGEARGQIKVLTVPGKDRILGVTICGAHAGEMIAEFVLAMKHGLGLNKLLGTIHVYPTWMEANKAVAGVWRRQHAPRRLLDWLERWHAWRRGG
ncbi:MULTISPECIES: FAD-dependent oxidoreductase [unclassified Thioalkalivibrio]|uniref:FAD-dependent oxidoreductase n=1 Tax=unclassified Thioalkalivibrio TaxID=2621013 RepID=UPI0003762523|nr:MULTISPECIES: bifunctional TVP38/TMEM64 family protein/FAD-dependent oxidoreductase [unclassified Thioalkalivibrio]